MRRRRLKRLWARLQALQRQQPTYETLLLKLGAAQQAAGRAASLVAVTLPPPPSTTARARRVDFTFVLDRAKLRQVRQREGRYLLRSNLTATDPAHLWEYYLRLVEVEAAFKTLKDELAVRPIYHQRPARIERISSWPSSPTACTSPCGRGSGPTPPGPPSGKSSTSSPPCNCSMCTSPRRTAGS